MVAASFCGAGFGAGVGDAGDEPFSVYADHVEEVGAAVVDFAVDQEVKGCPDHGKIVVDADERIVNALFYLVFAGLADTLGKSFEGHLRRFAVAHEHHGSAGECGSFDRRGISFRHAVEHGVDGSEYCLLIGGLGEGGEAKGCGEDGGYEGKESSGGGHGGDCSWRASAGGFWLS